MPSIEISATELGTAATLRKVLRRFHNESAVALREFGLTNERYELLLAIGDAGLAGRAPTIAELAIELQLAQSSVTQLVRRAQAAGLVYREVSDQDARVRHLVLTIAGAELLATAVARLGPEHERLVDVLSMFDGARAGVAAAPEPPQRAA